jgi:predicted RNase H-like HicB family nuclease
MLFGSTLGPWTTRLTKSNCWDWTGSTCPSPGSACFRAVGRGEWLYRDGADEGGYWAEVPGFPECVSEGDTLDEVRVNIREAFLGMVEAMQDRPTVEEPGRAEVIAL